MMGPKTDKTPFTITWTTILGLGGVYVYVCFPYFWWHISKFIPILFIYSFLSTCFFLFL